MEKLIGARAMALPYANEIHVDSKYKNTDFSDELIQHEMKHIQRLNQINHGKKRYIVFLKDTLWDMYDCMRLDAKYDKPNFLIGLAMIATLFLPLWLFLINSIFPQLGLI